MAGEALSALAGLLGGLGKGSYEGYSAGIADRQKAAELTERQRQFDLARFTEVAPDLAKILGVQPGRMPTALVAPALAALEKQIARDTATRRAEETATAYEQTAEDFPEQEQRAGAMLEPEAAGIQPRQRPNRILTGMARLSRAEAPKEDIAGFLAFIRGQAKDAGDGAPSQLMVDEQGRVIAIPKPKGLTGPTDTGVQSLTLRSSQAQAAYQRMVAEAQQGLGPQPGTPEFRIELGKRMEDIIKVAPGEETFRKSEYPGVGGHTNQQVPVAPPAAQPPQVAGPRPTYARPVQPSNDAQQDLANADAALEQLAQVRELVASGALNEVLGGVGKNPGAAFARTREKYFGEGMNYEQRAVMAKLAIQLQAIKKFLIGATRTMPELEDIANSIPNEKSFWMGDTAEQMLPKLDGIIDNIQIQADMRRRIMERSGVRTSSGTYVPPATGTGAASGPTLPNQIRGFFGSPPGTPPPSAAPQRGPEKWERGPDGKLQRVR